MADFKAAWAITSKNEGGYVNDSKDPGKETYRGISFHFWPAWEGWPIVHQVIIDLRIENTLDAGRAVWQKITDMLAGNENLNTIVGEFYKKNFWDKLSLDTEPNQLLANDSFDTAVNMGIGEAKKLEKEGNDA